MSSYGSRAHKVSSIYRRVNGLLKNGALKDIGRVKFFQTFENASEDLHNLFSQHDNGTHLSKFIAKGRSMGADANMELWEDDQFIENLRISLQKDGIISREGKKPST
nr:hypothetical transcript [Hymenolepis microstoma]